MQKRPLTIVAAKVVSADKADLCMRGYCSRRKPSHLLHDCRCVAADVTEAVVETHHEKPKPNCSFAAVGLNHRDAEIFQGHVGSAAALSEH